MTENYFYELCAKTGRIDMYFAVSAWDGNSVFKVLYPRLYCPDRSSDKLFIEKFFPFLHDPIPEHEFDESTFSIQTSEDID